MTEHQSSPRIVSGYPYMFSRVEMDLYERLILENPRVTEHEAAQFFTKFPRFLFLGQGIEIRREVALYHSSGLPVGRVDFFRKRIGSSHWDVIEIKSPNRPLVVGTSGNHPRLSATVFEAINQAQNYRQLLDEDPDLRAKLITQGIRIFRPHLLIVVGKDDKRVDEETMLNLFDRVNQGHIKVYSYSDLYTFAKDLYESSQVLLVPGNLGTIGLKVVTEVAVECPRCEEKKYHYYKATKYSYWLCSGCDLFDDIAEHYPIPGRCPKCKKLAARYDGDWEFGTWTCDNCGWESHVAPLSDPNGQEYPI